MPYDPYGDLPSYATVPPLSGDFHRGSSARRSRIAPGLSMPGSSASRSVEVIEPRRARPGVAAHGLALTFALVPLLALGLSFLADPDASTPTIAGVEVNAAAATLCAPLLWTLALLDARALRAAGLSWAWVWAVIPPLHLARRLVRTPTWGLWAACLGSAAMLFTWFAPLAWVDVAASPFVSVYHAIAR